MLRKSLIALAILGAVSACASSSSVSLHTSQSPSASAAASASTAPSASPSDGFGRGGPCVASLSGTALMAVLERKASGFQTMVGPFQHHDTVAIAGLNAVARAHATFQPRSMPYIGNAATLLSPREAYTVHGVVDYIDGLGNVWSLGVDGHQTSVARFPITLQQQEVSFAVSSDGCHLMAAALTIPPKGAGDPFPTLNGTWKLDVMQWDFDGAAKTIKSWSSASFPGQPGGFQNLVLVGWDSVGPLVVVGSALGTQNGNVIDNFDFFGGSVAHLGADGTPGPAIAMPSGCAPVRVTPAGDITCATQSSDGTSVTIQVISSSGAVEVPGFTVKGYPDVAAATGGFIAVTGQWRKGSSTGTLPANFEPEGWIDPNTIFGRLGTPANPPGNAALAHLSGSGSTVENLGFAGDYVGMLTP